MEPRPTCARCERPLSVCYCAHLTQIESETRVVFLQHPREEGLGIGTARMASLCLPNSEIHVGVHFRGVPAIEALLADRERPAALLYPGPDAIDVTAHPPDRPITLILVDGTWPQAKKIVRVNPQLSSLPRYSFVPPAPSEYRIRKEPQADYLSTIESLAHVLGALERDPERFLPLRRPFSAMVETQIAYAKSSQAPRHKKRKKERPSLPPAPPAIFAERFTDLVCVVAESNAWSFKSGHRETDDPGELVHCVALRPSTGELLDVVLAPRGPLAPGTPHQIDLDEATLGDGADLPAFLLAWHAFARPSDVIVTWGTHTLNALMHEGATLSPERVDVRRASRILANRRVGPIETYYASLTSEPSERRGRGRGGKRLGMLVDIARRWARGLGAEARPEVGPEVGPGLESQT